MSSSAVVAAPRQKPVAEPKVERQVPTSRGPTGRGPAVLTQEDIDRDARQTREQFRQLLSRYPPTLGRVLKMDPSLISNDAYLSAYPGVAAFLAQHPEVAHNPSYFLEFVRVSDWDPPDRQSQVFSMWRNMMEAIGIFSIIVFITTAFAWLIKTLIDYRRWHRVSKVHTEVHTKLLDRLTSNEDLLAYIQTPAGRRFLEAAPIPLEAGPRAIAAPLGRILWSIQVGTVLGVGGIGLQFVSGRVLEEIAQPIYVIGVLALSLGAGFLLSAIAAFLLSRRLGLLEPPPPARSASEP
ncbi:MAG: hypothetical protein HYS05_07780 [Acidobacteria bacterium]|nr:hypothetical protein [Acidobacteriota bacterium]